MSALVLLNTEFFPGHPTAEALSGFHMFLLCLGAPLLIGAVFIGLGLGLGNRNKYAEQERLAGLYTAPEREAVTAHTPQRALLADETLAH